MQRPAVLVLLGFGLVLAVTLALLVRLAPAEPENVALGEVLDPFLAAHCVLCHGGPQPQGGLRLDQAWTADAVRADAPRWTRLAERLRRGDMPPAGQPRPSNRDQERVLRALAAVLPAPGPPGRGTAPARVTLRRLNRVEYERSVLDLLGVAFAADETFPADDVGYGFDRVGDVLTLPPILLEKYLLAAEGIAAEAVPDEDPDAPTVRAVQGQALEAEGGARLRGEEGHWVLFSTAEVAAVFDLPRDGRYRLRAEAFGHQAGDEPARMAFIVDGRPVATVDVRAEAPTPAEYGTEVLVEGGARRVGLAFVNDYYQPDAADPAQRDRNLVVCSLCVEGPLDPLVRPPGRPPLLPRVGDGADAGEHLRATLGRLARRAWRTRIDAADLERLLDAVEAAAPADASLARRLQLGIQMILVSPRFLFRFEADPADPAAQPGEVRSLGAYELASRLASFLWSSLPDEELLERAEDGSLLLPEVLHAQVDRLLDDARASSLAAYFAPQWLQIADLDRRRPDAVRFPGIDADLLAAMGQETMLLFDAVLREGRDVQTLLAADFTFVDERLALHYGIPGVRGPAMRRVPLPREAAGGVLTHASVLTATSNPTRTSPVKRGKWILEALLGAAPPPPPPGVGVIDDSREADEAETLRARLARHRADPTCAVCHDRLDPLGFALENYDAVGRRRLCDDVGRAIDATGVLPDGRALDGVESLRRLLLEDPAFPRSLTRHLLIYALGRGLGPSDADAVDDLLVRAGPRPTLRALLHGIVDLESFQATACAGRPGASGD